MTAAAGLHDWMSPEADATGGGREGRECEGSRDRDKEKEEGGRKCGRKKAGKEKGERHSLRIIRMMIKIKQPFQKPEDATGSAYKEACDETPKEKRGLI